MDESKNIDRQKNIRNNNCKKHWIIKKSMLNNFNDIFYIPETDNKEKFSNNDSPIFL